ncbi:MAG: hypothetical protein IJO08_04840 [Clostridia bacterium]|nr:hypothetical protein [Clostridia bacterium]
MKGLFLAMLAITALSNFDYDIETNNTGSSIVIQEKNPTLELALFSGFTNDVAVIQDMVYTSTITLKGNEIISGIPRSNAQLYNVVARGGRDVIKYSEWLQLDDANKIVCTQIEAQYAYDSIGADLLSRKVSSSKSASEEMQYFVTNKGNVFVYPPYEYDNKAYVNGETTIKDEFGNNLTPEEVTSRDKVEIKFATGETVIVSNETDVEPYQMVKGMDVEGKPSVWYPRAGEIKGIDFSKYDNTK